MPDQSEAPIVRRLCDTNNRSGYSQTMLEAAEIIRLCEEALEAAAGELMLIPNSAASEARRIAVVETVLAVIAQIKGQNP